MKQWMGLFKKEWISMRGSLYVTALIAIMLLVLLPFVLTRMNSLETDAFEVILMICFFWLAASILIPVIALFNGLEKEMKRPDVWLHSTASAFQLFGTKSTFAALIGAVCFLVPTIFIAFVYGFANVPLEVPFNDMATTGIFLVVSFFFSSIMIMCMGLFFWVLNQLMKPYIKGLSIPALVVLFFILSGLFEKVRQTAFYEKVTHFGPIEGFNGIEFDISKGNFFIETDTDTFYTGEFIVTFVFIVVLFIVSIVLFDRKVRS